jgi:adenosylcobinamide-phosphate synthase
MIALSILAAYAIDLLLGDPAYAAHPVRILGRLIPWYESKLRTWIEDDRRAGFVLALALPLDTYLAVWLALWLAAEVHGLMAFAAGTFLIYSALSVKDLADHVSTIHEAVEAGHLGQARTELAKIVGRDTQNLSEKEIIRAAVETAAEGTLDGIVSPLFYAGLGGAPLAMAFKAVSTLDSMVGYQNDRYREFGSASARLDDILNFIPARLSVILIAMGALLSGDKVWQAFRLGWRDGLKNPSPNSGFPEAAFAGALGVKLGGVNTYEGTTVAKPILHEKGREAALADLVRSTRLMYFSSFFALLMALSLRWVIEWSRA